VKAIPIRNENAVSERELSFEAAIAKSTSSGKSFYQAARQPVIPAKT
jgi:hypothetical protein